MTAIAAGLIDRRCSNSSHGSRRVLDVEWQYPSRCRRSAPAAVRLTPVAFRQQVGPAASAKQTQRLLALFMEAGYGDFRTARGPFGLTQRQGLGKFTHAEAEAMIERLESEAVEVEAPTAVTRTPPQAAAQRPLLDASTEELAAELRRRGWTVSDSS